MLVERVFLSAAAFLLVFLTVQLGFAQTPDSLPDKSVPSIEKPTSNTHNLELGKFTKVANELIAELDGDSGVWLYELDHEVDVLASILLKIGKPDYADELYTEWNRVTGEKGAKEFDLRTPASVLQWAQAKHFIGLRTLGGVGSEEPLEKMSLEKRFEKASDGMLTAISLLDTVKNAIGQADTQENGLAAWIKFGLPKPKTLDMWQNKWVWGDSLQLDGLAVDLDASLALQFYINVLVLEAKIALDLGDVLYKKTGPSVDPSSSPSGESKHSVASLYNRARSALATVEALENGSQVEELGAELKKRINWLALDKPFGGATLLEMPIYGLENNPAKIFADLQKEFDINNSNSLVVFGKAIRANRNDAIAVAYKEIDEKNGRDQLSNQIKSVETTLLISQLNALESDLRDEDWALYKNDLEQIDTSIDNLFSSEQLKTINIGNVLLLNIEQANIEGVIADHIGNLIQLAGYDCTKEFWQSPPFDGEICEQWKSFDNSALFDDLSNGAAKTLFAKLLAMVSMSGDTYQEHQGKIDSEGHKFAQAKLEFEIATEAFDIIESRAAVVEKNEIAERMRESQASAESELKSDMEKAKKQFEEDRDEDIYRQKLASMKEQMLSDVGRFSGELSKAKGRVTKLKGDIEKFEELVKGAKKAAKEVVKLKKSVEQVMAALSFTPTTMTGTLSGASFDIAGATKRVWDTAVGAAQTYWNQLDSNIDQEIKSQGLLGVLSSAEKQLTKLEGKVGKAASDIENFKSIEEVLKKFDDDIKNQEKLDNHFGTISAELEKRLGSNLFSIEQAEKLKVEFDSKIEGLKTTLFDNKDASKRFKEKLGVIVELQKQNNARKIELRKVESSVAVLEERVNNYTKDQAKRNKDSAENNYLAVKANFSTLLNQREITRVKLSDAIQVKKRNIEQARVDIEGDIKSFKSKLSNLRKQKTQLLSSSDVLCEGVDKPGLDAECFKDDKSKEILALKKQIEIVQSPKARYSAIDLAEDLGAIVGDQNMVEDMRRFDKQLNNVNQLLQQAVQWAYLLTGEGDLRKFARLYESEIAAQAAYKLLSERLMTVRSNMASSLIKSSVVRHIELETDRFNLTPQFPLPGSPENEGEQGTLLALGPVVKLRFTPDLDDCWKTDKAEGSANEIKVWVYTSEHDEKNPECFDRELNAAIDVAIDNAADLASIMLGLKPSFQLRSSDELSDEKIGSALSTIKIGLIPTNLISVRQKVSESLAKTRWMPYIASEGLELRAQQNLYSGHKGKPIINPFVTQLDGDFSSALELIAPTGLSKPDALRFSGGHWFGRGVESDYRVYWTTTSTGLDVDRVAEANLALRHVHKIQISTLEYVQQGALTESVWPTSLHSEPMSRQEFLHVLDGLDVGKPRDEGLELFYEHESSSSEILDQKHAAMWDEIGNSGAIARPRTKTVKELILRSFSMGPAKDYVGAQRDQLFSPLNIGQIINSAAIFLELLRQSFESDLSDLESANEALKGHDGAARSISNLLDLIDKSAKEREAFLNQIKEVSNQVSVVSNDKFTDDQEKQLNDMDKNYFCNTNWISSFAAKRVLGELSDYGCGDNLRKVQKSILKNLLSNTDDSLETAVEKDPK